MLDDRPDIDAGDPPAQELYGLDIRRMSPSELYRLAGGPIGFLLSFLLFKVLRLPFPQRAGIARPEELVPVVLEDVPGPLRELFEPAVAACEAEGFRRLLVYSVPSWTPQVRGVAAMLCDDDRAIGATVMASEARAGRRVRSEVHVTFDSRWPDGRYLATTNARLHFSTLPEVELEHHPKASTSELLARHRRRMEDHGPDAFEPFPEDVSSLLLEQEQRWFDFQREREVLVPLTPRERSFVLRSSEAARRRSFVPGMLRVVLAGTIFCVLLLATLLLALLTC